MMQNLIRLDAVKRKIGLGRSQIYEMMLDGKFPRQVKLGLRASGWVESEIDDWIKQRIAERDAISR